MKVNKSGFSLIELSIVLIIVGFLVVAVISGNSLVQSAKINSIITNVNDLKTAFFTFSSIYNRLPGDIDDDKVIGDCGYSGCNGILRQKTSNVFGGEYYGKEVSASVGPWVDLYLQKLTNFKPNPDDELDLSSYQDCTGVGSAIPYFKNIKNTCVRGFKTFLGEQNKNNGYYLNIYSINLDKGLSVFNKKIIKKLDEKVDDGILTKGKIFFDCSNYEEQCLEIFYMFYKI